MRYLLCRPFGGLNDILVQIERCCQYAKKNQRVVVVDTNYRYTEHFRDNLSNYFISSDSNLILDVEQHKLLFNELEVFPTQIKGRIFNYEMQWSEGFLCDKSSLTPITFDFSKDYPQSLLVHQQCGGGNFAHMIFLRLRLKEHLINQLKNRIEKINISLDYESIHIRNTGYTTNYQDKLAHLKVALSNRKIFLATDEINVLSDLKNYFGKKNIFSFSRLTHNDRFSMEFMPQDKAINMLEIKRMNEDAILDLLMLALAKNFHFFPLDKIHATAKCSQPEFSGYSILAKNLWSSKMILKILISRDDVF